MMSAYLFIANGLFEARAGFFFYRDPAKPESTHGIDAAIQRSKLPIGFLISFGYISILMAQQPDNSPAKQLFACGWLGYHTFAATNFTRFVLSGKAKRAHYFPCIAHLCLFFGFIWYLQSTQFKLNQLNPLTQTT